MALSKEIYAAFEAVVGKNNISQDPGVLQTYRCRAPQSSAHYGPYDHTTPTPQAVVLPGSTKEVQGVVRLCNKYKIKFKCSTTFWSAHGYIGSDYAIQIDMRRMNGVEIDEKNMVAIIGPYAIAATVQAEAMKHGLTCNIPGVGCSSAIIANTASWGGPGPSSVFTGNAYENLMCMEYVCSSGEILETGSLGYGAGWTCGEGAGPSLKAIIRGGQGTRGELGICTKMSIKLSPWPGHATLETVGTIPAYRASNMENFRAYCIDCPSWEAWGKCVMKINDNNLLYLGHRQFSMFGNEVKAAMLEIITDPEKQMADLPALMADPVVSKNNENMAREFHIIIAGFSEKDLAWKEAALDEILKEFGCWKDEWFLEPEHEAYLKSYLMRLGHKNLNYVMVGGYEGCFGMDAANQPHTCQLIEEAFTIHKQAQVEGTYAAAVGGDTAMGSLGGHGGGGGPMGWEFFSHFDPHDPESIKGTAEYHDRGPLPFMKKHGLGVEMGHSNANCRKPDGYAFTQEEHNAKLAALPGTNPFIYQWYVREYMNPNHLGDSYYETCDPEAVKNAVIDVNAETGLR